MAGITSLVIGAVGLGVSAYGQSKQLSAQKKAASAQRRQEKLREREMRAEANRQRRASIREAMVRRGQAVNAAAGALGGEITGSSLVNSISANTFGQAGYNVGQTNISESLGGLMFDAKADESRAVTQAAIGSGISSLGGTLMNNNTTLANLFSIGGTGYGIA